MNASLASRPRRAAGLLFVLVVAPLLFAMIAGPALFFALGGWVPFHRVMDRSFLLGVVAALILAGQWLPLGTWWPMRRLALAHGGIGLGVAFISVQTILSLDAACGGIERVPLDWPHLVHLIVTAVVAALLVPLVEETLFRGFLQTEMTRWLGRRAGWLLAGLLFALTHFIKVPAALDQQAVHVWSGPGAVAAALLPLGHHAFLSGRGVNLLLLGLLLGALFWRTGMLWFNYGLHGGLILGLLMAVGLTRHPAGAPFWTGADLLSSPLTTLVFLLLAFWLWLIFRRPPPRVRSWGECAPKPRLSLAGK